MFAFEAIEVSKNISGKIRQFQNKLDNVRQNWTMSDKIGQCHTKLDNVTQNWTKSDKIRRWQTKLDILVPNKDTTPTTRCASFGCAIIQILQGLMHSLKNLHLL